MQSTSKSENVTSLGPDSEVIGIDKNFVISEVLKTKTEARAKTAAMKYFNEINSNNFGSVSNEWYYFLCVSYLVTYWVVLGQ